MRTEIQELLNVDFNYYGALREWEHRDAIVVLMGAKLQAITANRDLEDEDFEKQERIVREDLVWLADQLGLCGYENPDDPEMKTINGSARFSVEKVLKMASDLGYVLPKVLSVKLVDNGLNIEQKSTGIQQNTETEVTSITEDLYEMNTDGLSVENIDDANLQSLNEEAYEAVQLYAALFAGILISKNSREFTKLELERALKRTGFKDDLKLKTADFDRLWKAVPKKLKNSGRKSNL